MANGIPSWRLWATLAVAACCWISVFSTPSPAAVQKRVMILHSVGREFRPWNEYAKQIREELDRQSPWPLDVQEHSLLTARSGDTNPEAPFAAYLEALYSGHTPDLIVGIGAPAAAFVQRHRQQLFPGTPALFTAIEQRRVDRSSLTENDTIVAVKLDFRFLFESFLRVSPDTRIVAVVEGSSPNELYWEGEMKRELKPLEDRIEVRWYDGLSFEDLLKQTSTLPPRSAIFWNQMLVDGAGIAHDGDTALTTLWATANAPIFTHDDAFFGREIVGGPMQSARALSKTAASVAIRILSGEKPGDINVPPSQFATPKYNWRELRRWNISENRLPPQSTIYFREQTLWDQYRWQIVLVCAVILLQAALITGLLRERHARVLAEIQSRQRMAELAHTNRYAMAGELTASIAHELNQPLGSILTNAETAELMLKSPAPNLGEIGTILADIRRDDARASEVIHRLRSLLKKAPFELKNIDLNEIVDDTIKFLSALAIAREIELAGLISPVPLPIRGDRVQLQQVILNLVVNAMDAMSGLAKDQRRIVMKTARNEDFAEVSVEDAGPGILPDKLKDVFEPFFTTKSNGMGMGLSIARTIVEAHDGHIWAENLTRGGAVFHIRLPLATLRK
jgi:signal transduction histidine kinase